MLDILTGAGMTQAGKDEESTAKGVPAKRASAQDKLTWKIIGAFISASGVGVVAIAITTLRSTWFPNASFPFEPLWLEPYVLAALAAIAAWALFRANTQFATPQRPPKRGGTQRERAAWREQERLRHKDDERKITSSKRWLSTTIAGVTLFSVAFLIALAMHANERPAYEQYAITIPTTAAPSEPGEIRTRRTTSSTSAENAGVSTQASDEIREQTFTPQPTRDAVLVWWVKKDRNRLPSGLLPLALGGIFLAVFGAYFPAISLAVAESTAGLVEKLAGPVLGMALVGVGATQQVESDKAQRNYELAQRGLPPVVGLPEHQGAAQRELWSQELRTLERERLSADGIELIQAQLAALAEILSDSRQHDASMQREISSTVMELRRLQKFVGQQTPTPDPRENLRHISDRVGHLNESARTIASQIEDAQKRRCALAKLSEEQTALRVAELRVQAKSKRDARAHYDRDEFWPGINRLLTKPPPNGAAEDKLADALQNASKASGAERWTALCPQSLSASNLVTKPAAPAISGGSAVRP